MKIKFLISVFFFNISFAQISDFKAIDFTRADNIAKLNSGASLDNLPLLVHNLTVNLSTDVEKFRAMYIWICHNIKGDFQQENKIIRKKKKFQNDSLSYINWNNKYKKIVFKKLLKHKKTMCTGYAYLIKELCFLANIECEIVDGYGRTADSNVDTLEFMNHSWNSVKLNNKWYLCDATWSSGYAISDNIFIKDFNIGYFLTDPELFAKSHYPSNKKWLLNSTLINSKFIASPLVYSEAFTHKIIPVYPEKMNVSLKKNTEINFSLKSLKNISLDNISLVYFSDFEERQLKIYELIDKNGLIQFKHKFKSKGNYDIHLKVKNDIVATYTFEIIKG